MLPPVIKTLLGSAPNVRLRAAQVGLQDLHTWLESARSISRSANSRCSSGIKRQKLFSGQHMCIFQKDHPRLVRSPSLAEFLDEQHIFITAAGTGHPHQVAERSLESQLPAKNIIAHVPSFKHRCDPGQEHQCGGDDAGVGCDRTGTRTRHAACEAADQAAGIRSCATLA